MHTMNENTSPNDVAVNQLTTQKVNYGTMETAEYSSLQYALDLNRQELVQGLPHVPRQQEAPKPAVRQRIQRIQKQIEVTSTSDNKNVTLNSIINPIEDSETIHQLGKNSQLVNELNQRRMIKSEDMKENNVENNTDQQKANQNHEQSSMISKGIALPLPSELGPPEKRPYPKKVLFIIANEFCERFSYYGLRAILVLYFKSVFGFSDSNSTVSFHLFATLCYITPIMGAILGDSIWGKFRTILYLSIVYLLGEISLVISSVIWTLNEVSVAMTFLGLLLIGIGTGGIKPCVSALGGDQFLPSEIDRRENFFSLFYATINLGALISLFSMPVLRSQYRCVNRSDCYPFAFGIPCLLMFVAIVFFLSAAKKYVLVPLPRENVILAFCKCTWLAFRRKMAGQKLPRKDLEMMGHINHSMSITESTSNSSLSSVSSDEVAAIENKISATSPKETPQTQDIDTIENAPAKNDHWLYLASDRYDTKTIEGFRSVWRFILLCLPTPVYWCLFDQQGSLWTLQATRMNGKVFGSNMMLEPDQMSVANPVLLLTFIPIFQFIIYPTFNKYDLLTTPIQKMSVGGFLAALTFVASAMIELKIQSSLPSASPAPGYSNLLVVNGLSDCSINNASISYVQIPDLSPMLVSGDNSTFIELNKTSPIQTPALSHLEPLSSVPINLVSGDLLNTLNNYKFTFELSNDLKRLVGEHRSSTINATSNHINGCSFEPNKENEFIIGPFNDGAVKLLYVEQGNGKLTYRLFNDSLELPTDGKARVRVLFEFFGSFVKAEKRQFILNRLSNTEQENSNPHPELEFRLSQRNGQVLISDYIDVVVPTRGAQFVVKTNDSLLRGASTVTIDLRPGTRNLLIVQQVDATSVEVKQEILQDNEYRINILYQLIPYLMISVSEIMFSIPILELAYGLAPETMKSVVLAFGSLTVALGNILTVAVESAHLFSNIVYDFLFYASLMALDVIVFALIGYYFGPSRRKPEISTQPKAKSNES